MEILNTILAVLTNPIVEIVIAGICALAIKKWVNYKALYTEVIDIPQAYIKVRKPGSPGGKQITAAEYAIIGKEIVEAIQAGAKTFKKGGSK